MTKTILDERTFNLWVEYEKVAMHFNGLLIQLRLRALAGIGAITTLASFFVADDSGLINWGIIAFVSFGLFVAWAAIFVIDYFYYFKLLQGSVNAITALERSTQHLVPTINLSTLIETEASKTGTSKPWNFAILFFYAIIALMLLVIGFVALHFLGINIPCFCVHKT